MIKRSASKVLLIGLLVRRLDNEAKLSFLLARTFLVTLDGLKLKANRINEAKIEKLYKDD